MNFKNFSGVFALYERTKLIENGSADFADKNFSIKNNTDFSYATASGTKGFTAAAILMLVAEKRLSLDSSVKQILLKSDGAVQKYGSLEWLSDAVTIRSLLSHTSGVPDYFDEEIFDDFEGCLHGNANYHYEKPEDFFPLTEAVWKKQKTPYSSAGNFKYSNGGFVILAAVVEAVTGSAFSDYVSKNVFAKLEMHKSGFFRLDEAPPAGIVRATGYQTNGRSNVYGVPVIGGGDGGAFTTVFDMANFWNKLDPELNPQSALAPLIEEAWKPQLKGDDGLYGLGFWMRHENPRIVFLEGFDPGVQFFSFYNRGTKRSLTICLNDEQTNCNEIFEKYYNIVE
ncbi:MAG: beta-lactamase family protein [Spirochaetaceae bacterium]|nr:beta-lactamase family protein [Spirochaetaceae bacterium]